ncbi:FAD-binding protein [Clostridiales bacterium COT073_COT-073]|nr:FAD-binding protein [Clostridiales bacterium COT073_COT-073]
MYQKLMEPGYIGKLKLKNRVVMPAMGTSLASSNGEASDQIIAYYEERAKGGCGLIITEITRIDNQTGVGTPNQLWAIDPRQIPRLERLARSVHRHGAKIFLQLHHPGRQSHARLIEGRQIVSASDVMSSVVGEVPRPLTTEEVEQMVKDFVKGAKIAEMAGIDGIELHAAHGYLLCQFLSPTTNKRTDKYGGDFTNCHRFITEIIMGIRYLCGKDFPISVRIDGDEFVEGGIRLEDAIKTAKYLESIGVDAINISAGTYETANTIIEPYTYPQGWKRHLAQGIKDNVSIPVIACDAIKDPDFAEKLLQEGNCDFIALGRAHLADPYFVKKAVAGQAEEIRPCIGCLHCIESLMNGITIRCAVNPLLGYEKDYQYLPKDGNGKVVCVIGGGPGGLQSAITLAGRGFKVTLFEQKSELGGSVRLGSRPPHKELLFRLIKSLEIEAKKAGVEIKLNTKPSIEELKQYQPYAVIAAIGGKEITIPLTDAGSDKLLSPIQVLEEQTQLKDKKIVVVGSGMTGLEMAEYFAAQGNEVVVVEMAKEIGPGVHKAMLVDIMTRLQKMKVSFMPSHKLLDYKDGVADLMDNSTSNSVSLPTDYLVLSIGVTGQTGDEFIQDLESNFTRVCLVGDCQKAGRIYEAMVTGFDAAYHLPGEE